MVAPEEAWRTGWPAANGPHHDWLPLATGAAMVDDASKARLLRRSRDAPLGRAKFNTKYFRLLASKDYGTPGSNVGPVMAEGRVDVESSCLQPRPPSEAGGPCRGP